MSLKKFNLSSANPFRINSRYQPSGDQPKAISRLVEGLRKGDSRQTLLGVTGSGKTFTMANIIQDLNRPALILAHNKTLAAQLYSEFKDLFPDNAVRYFVSYYDYYQPEAYLPGSDTYIEKDAGINDELDKLRHSATKALLERRDTIVVSSVSCIYGLGDPEIYFDMIFYLEIGDKISRGDILNKLVNLQYQRNDENFTTGTFRVRGDVVEICPVSESDRSIRIELFDDEVEAISEIDKLTGATIRKLHQTCLYPATHYVTNPNILKQAIKSIKEELGDRLVELKSQNKILEMTRLEQRTLYDLELLEEIGFCSGIENYSRHLTARKAGEAPPTLLDYFSDDFICFLDESHVTLPQIRGMYKGDRSRKENLVEFGFRLPSALDNRPLKFEEFDDRTPSVIYVSATPGPFEIEASKGRIVEQIIRPTGVIDPKITISPAVNQVDDFLDRLRIVVERGERALVTTLTKKLSEHLAEYYRELGVKVKYLHSEIHTLDRIDLIRALRNGEYDLLIGINLLREGLDIPEVSLVGIMDADKEGFLRSETSLIQTIGRAARNVNGEVILYADRITDSMNKAIRETDRRREIQLKYNFDHNIIPENTFRSPDAAMVEVDEYSAMVEGISDLGIDFKIPKDIKECTVLLAKLKEEMKSKAKSLEFEQAAVIRDRILQLEKVMIKL